MSFDWFSFLDETVVLLFSALNVPNNKAPIVAPYKVLLIGLDVIMQVPLEQPTKFQYRNPAKAPNSAPITYSLFLINQFFKYYRISSANTTQIERFEKENSSSDKEIVSNSR